MAEPGGGRSSSARLSEELAYVVPAARAGADHAAARLRPRARRLHGLGARVERPACCIHRLRGARHARVRDVHDGRVPVALRRLHPDALSAHLAELTTQIELRHVVWGEILWAA